MKATELLHNLGQSIWLDNVSSELLSNGTLKRYIEEFWVTGLTSTSGIFCQAIKNSSVYDEDIAKKIKEGKRGERLFFELVLKDLTQAADLFRPIFEKTNGMDGWVSLEISPLLAYDGDSSLEAARDLFERANRPNLFIKIPGTAEGLPVIEEAIFSGIPVNVTLLFTKEDYLAAAEAYMRGIERRLIAGLNANVASVASVFVSRWDAAVAGRVPESLKNKLGVAVARRIYKEARDLLTSSRWERIYNAGARPQRLLWDNAANKDLKASDVFYVNALAAPFTINAMPEATLIALSKRTKLGSIMSVNGGDCEDVLRQFAHAGIDIDALAVQLQEEDIHACVDAWNELMEVIESKMEVLINMKSP